MTPASAFECITVPNSNPRVTYVWKSRCVPYQISRKGTYFTGDARKLLVNQSFRVWSDNACTDFEFLDAGYTSEYDGFDRNKPDTQVNVIASVEDPAEVDRFPDSRLLAITLNHYVVATGEILDSDILFNGVMFRFDDVSDTSACMSRPTAQRPFDLRNTLVHEIGHLIGLEHVKVANATMYDSADACETKKRDLDEDDRLGLCTIYPKGRDASTCSPPPGGYEPENGLDPCPFRDQCLRYRTGQPSNNTCTSAKDPGGCSCVLVAGASTDASAGLGLVLLGSIVLWVRRRGRISGR